MTGSCSSATARASSPPPAAWAASCARPCCATTSRPPPGPPAACSEIFGPDHLYVELQDHGIADQIKANRHLIEIARHLDLPLLATNDSHYTHREDAVAHDALLCVQTGAQVDDPKRFKFEGSEHYLKTSAEMRALFAEAPEACDNTLRIAERVDVEIEFGKPELPRFTVPAGSTEDEYLRELTFEGARRRYGTPVPDAVAERIDHELGVIHRMGLSAYFLVVWDLIHHARRKGIRVGPGRGSAAGCCVAYCLQIVDVDPIRYGLIFERFLNEGRREMPDIDMDFDERYRGEMIRYAAERYGSDHVAQIVTFSTIKARAAVRDAARVLGYPYAVGDKIAKAMPPLVMGRDTPLDACLELTPGHEEGYKMASDLRALCEAEADVKKVVDVARGLAGLRRQDGIHAAAVVITREPLTEYLPVQRKPEPGGDPADAPIVTQYEMNGVAALGLLKMDFLGLRNLTVIERALDLIETSTGRRVDIDNVNLEDERTFDMLRKGDSVGVFQLEGGPMRALMRSLAPTCFDDVAALVALYRPGPDGGQHAQRLRRPQERAQAGQVPPPPPGGGAGRHPRADDLPGVDDAGGLPLRRLLPGGGRQPAQGVPSRRDTRAHQGPRLCAHRTSHEHAGSAGSDCRHGFVHVPLRADRRRVVSRHQAGLRADYVHGVLHPGHGGASFPGRGRVAGAARDRSRRPRGRGGPHEVPWREQGLHG